MQEIKTIKGVKYTLTKEKLKVGDKYYSPFMGDVQTYLDMDYGDFDPNSFEFPKATPINVA